MQFRMSTSARKLQSRKISLRHFVDSVPASRPRLAGISFRLDRSHCGAGLPSVIPASAGIQQSAHRGAWLKITPLRGCALRGWLSAVAGMYSPFVDSYCFSRIADHGLQFVLLIEPVFINDTLELGP